MVLADESFTQDQHQLLPYGYPGADAAPSAAPTKEFQLRLSAFTFHCPADGVHGVLTPFLSVLFSVFPQTGAAGLGSALPCAGAVMKE